MGGMGSTCLAHTSLFSLQMDGVSSLSSFIAGIMMLCVITFAYPAIAVVSLGSIMGVTLDLILNMIQWTPMVAFVLKFIPTRYLGLDNPSLLSWRLSTPDLFSTVITSVFAICASTYGLAGYWIGSLCYACDPIAYSIISGENGNRCTTLVELKLPVAHKTLGGWKRRRRKENEEYEAEEYTEEYTKESRVISPGIEHNEIQSCPDRSLFDDCISQDSDVENQ